MTDTVKARRPAKKPDGASSAPHAPAPHDTAPDTASPAWAQASVAAPFALGVPVQRKPVIGRADDAYEREADAVADRVATRNVVSAPLPISRVSASALAPAIQPKSIGDRTEHDDPTQPDAGGPGIIQRTPAVVQRAEDDEKPDEKAAAVQTKPSASAIIQRTADDEKPDDDSGAIQTKPAASAVIQRAEDEKPDEDSGAVQMKSVASAVVQRAEDEKPDEDSGAVQTKPSASAVFQRAEDDEKPDDNAGTVQTKPAASVVVQRAEDETPDQDSGAVQMKAATSAVVQRAEDEKPDEDSGAVQTKPAAPAVVQREEDEDEDEEKREAAAAARAKGERGGVAGGSPAMRSAAEAAIATRGPGSPLPEETRARLEAGIGHGLGDVRVQSGPGAQEAASRLRARAFTHGRDIWLGRGESASDVKLMAHEATHVIQQGGVVPSAPAAPGTDTAAPPAGGEPAARPESAPAAAPRERPRPVAPPAIRLPALAARGPAPESTSAVPGGAPQPAGVPQPTAAGTARAPFALAGARAQAPVTSAVKPAAPGAPGTAAEGTPAPGAPVASPAPGATASATTTATAPATTAADAAVAESGTAQAAAGVAAGPGDAAAKSKKKGETKDAAPGGPAQAEADAKGKARGPSAAAAAGAEGMATAGGAPGMESLAGARAAGGGGSMTGALAGAGAGAGPAAETGGADAPDTSGGGEIPAQDEASAASDTAARMDAAQPDADREAEAAAEAEGEQAGPGGGTVPDPSLGSAEAAAGGGGAGGGVAEAADEPTAESGAESPEPAPEVPAAAEAPFGAGGGTAEATPSPADAATADAGAEPSPADSMTAELSPSERDAGLASIGEGGGEYAGGGGGGGSAIPEPPEPAAPALPADDPEAAMAAVSSLPPARLKSALGQVSSAAKADVGQQRQELAAAPPRVQRPSGSPQTKDAAGPSVAPASGEKGKKVEKAPEGAPVATPQPEPLPPPPPAPMEAVAAPEDPANVMGALGMLPVSDPGLRATAGPTPTVRLAGNADPAQVRAQKAGLDASVAREEAQGRADLAVPMGEDEIYPVVPPETLQATIPAGGAGAAGGPGGGGAGATGGGEADDATSIIAQEQHGEEIGAAAGQARGDMAARRQEHASTDAQERAATDQEVARLEAENAGEQNAQRQAARGDVAASREKWSTEQQELAAGARTEAETETARGETEVETERTHADTEARGHIQTGNDEAARARTEAETEAARKREEAKKQGDSGGVWGWVKSKAKAFFNKIKSAIKAAFDRARALVKAAIEKAKKLAVAVIEKARQAIVSVIRRVGDALIAIGDRVLAGFPALRDRWRSAVKERVASAEAAVNRLAERLKKDVVAALDALGAALDKALGLLEAGLLAAVDAVDKAVSAAIDAAKAVVDALGTFAVLIKDIASGPGRWLGNLGSAVVDGIKNHLWAAFKAQVKEWFNAKLESVLGLGTAIWDVLKKGGISIAQVGTMAFEALKAAIPTALVELLVEKLVAMIVPAAGAVMAIIEGLQAAWGAVQRILAAIGAFVAFLKAVRGGNAGPQFATALAAAAIAVIEFVAQWLLRRLMKPAKAVGGKIKAIAQRIMARIRKALKKVAARLKKVGKKILRKVKKAGRWVKKKLGIKGKKKDRKPKTAAERERDREREKQDRLDRAMAVIEPEVARLFARGVTGLELKARMLYWRARYRLTSVTLERGGDDVSVMARVNPWKKTGKGVMPSGEVLRRLVQRAAARVLEHPDVRAAAEVMDDQRERRAHIVMEPGVGFPAAVRHMRSKTGRKPRKRTHYRVAGVKGATEGTFGRWPAPEGVNREVERVGAYTPSKEPGINKGGFVTGRHVPVMIERLQRSLGVSGPALAGIIREFVRTGKLPRKLKPAQRRNIARIALLMFGREGARNPGTVAQAAMVLDLVGARRRKGVKNTTWAGAFGAADHWIGPKGNKTKTGGLFAMSMRGAQEAAQELQDEGNPDNDRVPKNRSKNAKELARREIEVAERWLEQQMHAQGLKAFPSRKAAEDFVYHGLLDFYLLRRTGKKGGGKKGGGKKK
ncbi:eCIS core domain-containing protein [Longimicrobium sp.]|uniref:eCIS core domain-containing protein n=1 Tax=Longimicrobium sp. TaxID=2029185 RepID=UPI003B3B71FC